MYKTNILFQPFLLLIDIIGYILFFWLRFRRFKEPKRILLIRLEHIGDVLLTTPAFRALRKRFPKAQIDVLVREFTAPILQKNTSISNIIVWNAPWLSSLGKKDSWSGVRRMILRLRKNKYDLAIDFHGDPRNILFASKIAKYRVGFGCRGFGFLLNKVVPYKRQHIIDRNLSLAKAVGAGTSDKRMELHLSLSDERFANSALKGISNPVLIAAGSGRRQKNWIDSRWAEVANSLIEKHGVTIILSGSKGEAEIVKCIQDQIHHLEVPQDKRLANRSLTCPEKVLNLCGRTTVTQLAAVIKQCKLVLSPDSGPMHIARAINKPLIGLFTVENPREWGYNEGKFQNIKKQSAKDITVEMVLEKIRSMRCL